MRGRNPGLRNCCFSQSLHFCVFSPGSWWVGCGTAICLCRCSKHVCSPYVYGALYPVLKLGQSLPELQEETPENLQTWDAVINGSGQQFYFPLLRHGKTEGSATGDSHQRSRQTHLPGCQISRQQIGRKLKNPKSDLVFVLGIQRGLKGSDIDIYVWRKTTTETSVSLVLPSL